MRFFAGVRLPEGLPHAQQVDLAEQCEWAANVWMRRTNTRLSFHDYEDLVADLAEAAVKISRDFDASRGGKFEPYLRWILPDRGHDWLRKHNGRTVWRFSDSVYIRHRETPLSLDAPIGDPDGDSRNLGDVLTIPESSPAADRASAFERLEHQASRCRAGDLRALRQRLLERDAA